MRLKILTLLVLICLNSDILLSSNIDEIWRDQLGIKPLYYAIQDGVFIFASEIKSIYCVLDKKPSISFSAVDDILRYRFVDDNNTIFEGIKKVMPGEHIVFNGKNLEREKYWELRANAMYIDKTEKQRQAEVEEFRELFEKVGKTLWALTALDSWYWNLKDWQPNISSFSHRDRILDAAV